MELCQRKYNFQHHTSVLLSEEKTYSNAISRCISFGRGNTSSFVLLLWFYCQRRYTIQNSVYFEGCLSKEGKNNWCSTSVLVRLSDEKCHPCVVVPCFTFQCYTFVIVSEKKMVSLLEKQHFSNTVYFAAKENISQ